MKDENAQRKTLLARQLAAAKQRGYLVASPENRRLITAWEEWCDNTGRPRLLATVRPGDEFASIEVQTISALSERQQRWLAESLLSATDLRTPGRPRMSHYGPFGAFSDAVKANEIDEVMDGIVQYFYGRVLVDGLGRRLFPTPKTSESIVRKEATT